MYCLSHVILLTLGLSGHSVALFQDDVGRLDFVIRPSGHGPTKAVYKLDNFIISSDSEDGVDQSSCYVASRSIGDGKLLWRRNVCPDRQRSDYHDLAVGRRVVVTIDKTGIVQSWNGVTGELIWSRKITSSNRRPAVWVFAEGDREFVAAAFGSETPMIFDGENVELVLPSSAIAHPSQRVKPRSLHPEVFCSEQQITVAFDSEDGISLWHTKAESKQRRSLKVSSDFVLTSDDSLIGFALVSCTPNESLILLSTRRGSTAVVNVTLGRNDGAHIQTMWKQEEGLGSISAAKIISASHILPEQASDTDFSALSHRLQSQWASLAASVADQRDVVFGFQKIAVLVSHSAHRLYGLYMAGENRGHVKYVVDLPIDAQWHRIVHGGASGVKSGHGINAKIPTRDALILSPGHFSGQLLWQCLDATDGTIHFKGVLGLSAPIAQIVPMAGKGGVCSQTALLLLGDGSILSIPDDDNVKASIASQTTASTHGMFLHHVRKQEGVISTFHLEDKLQTQLVGEISFPGENIVTVAYPTREELIQSPSSVLGDESLLLKYINPHIAAVISLREVNVTNENRISVALKKSESTGGQKRKPVGVIGVTPAESNDAPEQFNLFLNIVDLVSGRIIHRVGHEDAVSKPPPCILISENWVFYTFTNGRARRAVIGVLSLHEGMIGSSGLTAFTSPEQSASFTSLDARESKPEVLAKSFSLSQPATALGITSTRGGISNKKVILALLDGRIIAVDRKVLDPRRPIGLLKDFEKKEGLLQYSELIPTSSLMAMSHSQPIESVREIVTAPTDLESQSLFVAFGGPDVFFARTSPSRSFDLLPDSFSRTLLSLVVAALLVTLAVVQHVASSRMRKHGWL